MAIPKPNIATAAKTATTSAAVNDKLLAGAVASQSAIGSSINTAKLANLTDNIKSEVASLQNVPQQIQGSIRNGIGTSPTKSFSTAGADATFNAINGALTPKFNTGRIGQKSDGGNGSSFDASKEIAAEQRQLLIGFAKDTANDLLVGAGVLGALAVSGAVSPAIGAAGVMFASGAWLGARFSEAYMEVNPMNDTSSTPFQLIVTPGGIFGTIHIKSKPGNSTPTGLDQDVITGVFLTDNEAKSFSDNLYKAQGGQKGTPDPLTQGGGSVVIDLNHLAFLAQGGGAAGPIEGGSRFPLDGSPLVGSGSISPGTGSGFPGGIPGVPTVFAGSIATAGMANFSLALNASVAHL